jgi:MoxR-like ATPase
MSSAKNYLQQLRALRAELDKVVIGYERIKDSIILVLLADGNVLLKAVPGTAKTTLVNALQKAIENCKASRLQLTPDVRPSDIVGGKIWDPASRRFVTVWGPAVENDHEAVNLLLADELNRTTGLTLAALLQLAQEKGVTIGDTTRAMEDLYMICATINPVEQEGTYTLPEAMVDRFAVLLHMGYVTRAQEIAMLDNILTNRRKSINLVQKVVSKEDLLGMREQINDIAAQMSRPAKEYIVDLVRATRPSDDQFEAVHGKEEAGKLTKAIQYGASPRAIIWTAYLAAAHAFYNGQEKVTTENIKSVASDVLNHRLILKPTAGSKFQIDQDVLEPVLQKVKLIDGRLPE